VEGAEQGERLGAAAAGVGVVDDELLSGCVADVEGLVGESERPDLRMVELLGLCRFPSHRVRLPQPREVGAPVGQDADEVV
jgi:hypothetical protein